MLNSQSSQLYRLRSLFLFIALFFAVAFGTLLLASSAQGAAPPLGFEKVIISSGFTRPLDMEFMPSGDLLVAEKGVGVDENGRSALYRVVGGEIQQPALLTLSTNTYWDSGLLGFVLDPDFAKNGYLYIWYATGVNAKNWSGETVLRLSRFTYDHTFHQISVSSELILLDNIPWFNYHHGNSLIFDEAGNLYLGMGDRSESELSQDKTASNGKIWRITPTETGYTIPADNPFIGEPNVAPELFAYGLRNPYRMTTREQDNLIVIADVGAGTWEEVNELQAGANYGFPEREGPCPYAQQQPCPPAPANYTDPIFYYLHDFDLAIGRSGAITGIDFYEGSSFPEPYENKLFFADFNQNFIAVGDVSTGLFEMFDTEVQSIVDIEYFSEGLYALDLINGQILYYYYSGTQNQSPVAQLTVSPQLGSPPLEVQLSAAGSSDPDDTVLRYHWDFGDGETAVTSTPDTTHTYTEEGNFTVTLEVKDLRGATSLPLTREVLVYGGEIPTIELAIEGEAERTQFRGGDRVTFTAVRSSEDGLDPEAPYSWRVDLHHNQHAHPLLSNLQTISDTLEIPIENHDGDWNLWYRFYLTMHTDDGVEIVVTEEIYPDLVTLTFDSDPVDVPLAINLGTQQAPYQMLSIVGVEHTVSTPEEILYGWGIGRFDYWHWFAGWPTQLRGGQTSTDRTLTFQTPAESTQYSAQYVYDRPAELQFVPFVRQP